LGGQPKNPLSRGRPHNGDAPTIKSATSIVLYTYPEFFKSLMTAGWLFKNLFLIILVTLGVTYAGRKG
jgi:hypothetical protein